MKFRRFFFEEFPTMFKSHSVQHYVIKFLICYFDCKNYERESQSNSWLIDLKQNEYKIHCQLSKFFFAQKGDQFVATPCETQKREKRHGILFSG